MGQGERHHSDDEQRQEEISGGVVGQEHHGQATTGRHEPAPLTVLLPAIKSPEDQSGKGPGQRLRHTSSVEVDVGVERKREHDDGGDQTGPIAPELSYQQPSRQTGEDCPDHKHPVYRRDPAQSQAMEKHSHQS